MNVSPSFAPNCLFPRSGCFVLFNQIDPPSPQVMGLAWTNMGGATLYIEARGGPLERFESQRVSVRSVARPASA